MRQALAAVSLPAEPDDGQDPERVSDLIVMADTLEHRQGVSHVAFNFLLAEICGALEQGLAAGNAEIARRWANAGSRDYISRMLRGLSDSGFFLRATHTWRDEVNGRRRQRRTFNLNRENALVSRMLSARLGPAAGDPPPATNGGDPPDAEPAAPEPPPAVADAADAAPIAAPPIPPGGNGGDAPPPGQPTLPIADDDIQDEPQPRTVRRRPFTSRLLGR